MSYPTKIDLCDGKYSVIYDLETGQSECLRYGEKWRELCGDRWCWRCSTALLNWKKASDNTLRTTKTAART